MAKTIQDLIDEILKANQEQALVAASQSSKSGVGTEDRPSGLKRRGNDNFVWSGLSNAFNTKSGSPRFSVQMLKPAYKKGEQPVVPPENKNPQTYSWSAVTTMESGLVIPYLYGKVKTKGNVIQGHLGGGSAAAHNANTIAALIAVSKGPIDSFVSVKINGQVLLDSIDGTSSTYADTKIAVFDYRCGWNSQNPPSNSNDVYYNVAGTENIEVKYGTPVQITFDMTNYDDAWVFFAWPSGLYGRMEDSQDLFFWGGNVLVEMKKSADSTWTPIYNGQITANNQRTIVRCYCRLFLYAQGNFYNVLEHTSYDVRISKIDIDRPIDDTDRVQNSLIIEYLTVGNRQDFAYNGIAYAEIASIATETLNGSLEVELVVKGRLVKVYTTTSLYTVKWSDNPAWVCLDVLTQPIWGNTYAWDAVTKKWVYTINLLARHDGIDPSEIDIQSFIDWANYCDGPVTPPDYDPTDTKRCTFNGVFESVTNLWDAAQSVASNARAWLFPPCGSLKYRVVLDKITSVSQMFNTGNTIAGSFQHSYTSMVDRTTELQIDFNNEENDYESSTLKVVFPSANNVREDSFQLFGVTNPAQAWRRAMMHLNYNAYVTCEAEWDVGHDALTCEAGDVVGYQDELPQWGYGGRVVSSTATSILLDRPVAIVAGMHYNLTVRSSADVLTNYVISYASNPATGSTNTLYGTFGSDPKLYDPFSFGRPTSMYKPFRVIEIQDNGDFTYHIKGQEYNESVYNIDTDRPSVPTPNVSSLDVMPLVTITNLDEILIKKQDGSLSNCLDVYFVRPVNSLYARAEIYYRYKLLETDDSSNARWLKAGTTDLDYFRITNILPNFWYQVAVVTVNVAGRKGTIDRSPSSQIYTLGKAAPPSDVTNFKVTQDGKNLIFTWSHIADGDLWGYEIRQGATFVNSVELIDIQSANRYDCTAPLNGTYRFWIRAIDTSGNYSEIPSSYPFTVTGIDDSLNFVYDMDLVTNYPQGMEYVYNWSWTYGKFFTWDPIGVSPSKSPSKSPSISPSASKSPSESPSVSPSASKSPSISPSISPSASISPSKSPSASPSLAGSFSRSPSKSPSRSPSVSPSKSPSSSPSKSPSRSPSVSPSASLSPSKSPSMSPSMSPSKSPSKSPSVSPSASLSPSLSPSGSRSSSPSASPSAVFPSPSVSPSTSPSKSPSLSPSISPSSSSSPSASPSIGIGAVPAYWSDFTTDADLMAVFESDNIMASAMLLNATIRLLQDISIYVAGCTDQSYPTRTDQSYPNDTDQHKTSDTDTSDYISYLYYAYGDSLDPTNWTLYTGPVQANVKFMKVRSIVVAKNYAPAVPVSLTTVRLAVDAKDIIFEITDYEITGTTGATIYYQDYGYFLITESPHIQATISYGSLPANTISLVPYISNINSVSFKIELKDILGENCPGKVNIRIHAF